MTMTVELVEPEGELWSGQAEMVIARTVDGEIGLLSNHAPLIGILYEGSMVQIRPDGNGADIFAAVTGGFLSMANNRVSILARISNCPYFQACLARVVTLAEVYSICSRPRFQSRLPAWWVGLDFFSRRPSMTSSPPRHAAFSG